MKRTTLSNRGIHGASTSLLNLTLLFVLLVLFCTSAAAERLPSMVPGGRAVTVPKDLMPWVPWLVDGMGEELCPKLGDKTICQWPANLRLDVDNQGAAFALNVMLDADGWVPLPGSAENWPLEVEVDRKAAVVLAKDGLPATRLVRGQHQVSGRFHWTKAPETLPVPGAVAVVELAVKNRPVAFPRREEGGALWLQVGTEGSDQAPERTDIEVMRRIDDGVPLRVTTHIVLHVAGRTRELRLPQPLLADSRPLAFDSPIPLRFEQNGDLVLQIRAGEHRVELVSIHPTPPAKLVLPKRSPPWPNQEVWVFNPASALRQVVPQGAPTIDPAQTNLVEEWKKLQAFTLTPERSLTFETTRRGQPEPPPNQLTLARQLWLDLDGHGYTVRDKLTGTMNKNWRLELPVAPLGRAMVSGMDTLITKSAAGVAGVELRRGAIDLTAEWRFERSLRELPAVGWSTDIKRLSAVLSLPPGWEVLHVSGADTASNTWLSQWTLWGFFFVLVVAIAVARLMGTKFGLLALVTLVLSHERAGAPTALWVILLVLLALLLWVPSGRFRSLLRVLWLASTVAMAVVVTQFVVEEVRHAFFPITNRAVDHSSSSLLGLAPSEDVAVVQQEVVAAAEREPSSDNKEGGTGMRAKGDEGSMGVPNSRKMSSSFGGGYSEPSVDPDSVIQTGPGLPSWVWRSLHLDWSGPVQRDQRLGLWLLSPFYSGLLGCLRAALAAWLFYLIVRSTPYQKEPPKQSSRRPSFRPLVAAAMGLLTWCAPGRASADVDKALLDELKARLTHGPDCDPCVEVSALDLVIQSETLHAIAEVHAGAVTTYQVPGPARSWTPASVRVDGRPATAVILNADGFLHVRVDPGRHRIEVQGPVLGQDLTLTSGTAPRHVTLSAKGWTVDGIRDGHVEGSLHFSADADTTNKVSQADAPSHVALPPWLEIIRTLEVGVTFRVVTKVSRISPKGDPISLRYSLLPGEEITEAGAVVEQGQLVITMDRDQSEATYKSVLAARAKLDFVAAADRPWTEEWRFRCSALWHCDFAGLAPYQQLDEGLFAPRFRPWPKEQLSASFTKPVAARGDSRTIDRLTFDLTPGQRLLAADLRWTERVSKGDTEVVQLPAGAVVQSLKVNDKDEPIRVNEQRLQLALHPGSQDVHLTFYCPGGLGNWFVTPTVTIGGKAVNANLTVNLPTDRWLLMSYGPSWGPKVLLWAYLLLLVGAAYVLARLPKSPMRFWQWWLLGLGLTQVPVLLALAIASWFFVIVLRGAWEPGRRVWRVLFRLFVAAWTLMFLGCLTGVVYDGLVSNPDMLVSGGGNGLSLNWYVDRITNALPTARVLSVPIAIWRILNLLWALWLAASLVGWLRWGFAEYSRHGLWPKPAPKVPFPPMHVAAVTATDQTRSAEPGAEVSKGTDRTEG